MKRGVALGLLAALLAAGCAGDADRAGDVALPVTLLYGNAQCLGVSQPGLTWIDDPLVWRQRYQQLTSAWMNPPPLPVVDFSRAGVLLVAMGTRSSAGYVLRLAEPDARLADGVLTLQVDWQEPAPGYAQAQVLSSPCLLLRVPVAAFSRIRVLDRQGQERLAGDRRP